MDNTKISIQKDGNRWCILWGKNLQEGIAGFGDTPAMAVYDFACKVLDEEE